MRKASFRVLAAFGLAGGLMMFASGEDAVPRNAGATDEKERAADQAAIRRSSEEFAAAFATGDAHAVAAFWTEQGEYDWDEGAIRGRAEIEKAYQEHFEKAPGTRVEVDIHSIRFPSADTAIEEGVLRQVSDGPRLPTSGLYSTTHVREGGAWKISHSREWDMGRDRLVDLRWLIGTWKGGEGEEAATLTLTPESKGLRLIGKYTRGPADEESESGTMTIALDPETGRLRSWHFAADGGHGQSLWVRDGESRWALDAVGVMPDGTTTRAVNVLARISNDEFTWQSIDRMVGDDVAPETAPVKMVRVKSRK